MNRPQSLARTFLHIGVVAAVMAFVALVASAWTTPIGAPVPRVSAAPGIFLQIGDGGGTFVFSPVFPGTCEEDNLSPVSLCAASLEISNVGESDSSPLFYTIVAWADSDGVDTAPVGPGGDTLVACFNLNLLLGTADGVNVGANSSDGPLPGSELDIGDSQTWGLEVALDPANDCQAATTTVIVAVSAVGDEKELPDIDPGPDDDFDNPPAPTGNDGNQGGPRFSTTSNPPLLTIPMPSRQPGQQIAPVNEVPGVQRLPSTGSGGLMGSSGFDPGVFETAAMVLLLGVILAGFGLVRRSAGGD